MERSHGEGLHDRFINLPPESANLIWKGPVCGSEITADSFERVVLRFVA